MKKKIAGERQREREHVVEFIPIRHGIEIDHSRGTHIVGFKQGPARKREGWLVVLVGDGPAPHIRRAKRREFGETSSKST